MDETKAQDQRDEKVSHEMACPLCFLKEAVSKARRKHSTFFGHLMNAQIELLQAFKYAIDQQISCLEDKKGSMEEVRKATKIEVE